MRKQTVISGAGPAGSDSGVLIFVAALPFGLFYESNFIGQLYGVELALLFLFPIFLFLSKDRLATSARSVLWLMFLWLVVQAATDLYRDTYIGDYLRGWAKIVFFALDIYVLAKLLVTEARLLVFVVAWNIAYVGWNYYFNFDDVLATWKFGLGFLICNVIAAAVLYVIKSRLAVARIMVAVCFATAAASLFLNARNTFLSLSFSGLLFLIASGKWTKSIIDSLWRRSPLLIVLPAALAAYAAGLIYVGGAASGVFGEEARQKFVEQRTDASGDAVLAILAGGRDEFYSSTAAIADSPIIGYGSWARSSYYYSIYVQGVREHGTPQQIQEVDRKIWIGEPLIPTHSYLLGAWVEAGFVGALFWLLLAWRTFNAIRQGLLLASRVQVMILLNAFPFLWNIFFSPFGGTSRLVATAFIVLLLYETRDDMVWDPASSAASSAEPST